mgnify:CR=1 FL=1
MKVLVTGGAGYIGSHTCIELLTAGHEVCVIDNLSNGHIEAIERVKRLSNKNLTFFKLDIRDSAALKLIFSEFNPESVIHFAGLKAVAESVLEPLNYYDVNVNGTTSLLNAMAVTNCINFVFSSSATVYGKPDYLPYDEEHSTRPVNPYGRTKLMTENILNDWSSTNIKRRATALRYFNPVGAHPSTLIGEDPLGIPNNLMPFIAQVAVGSRDILNIFGDDYDTFDGTGVRDYIHVVDLARAHVAAIEKQQDLNSFEIINLGSGKGTSVLELVKAFELISGVNIKINISNRRDGDLDESWANPTKAFEKIGWKTVFNISDMCRDTWAWQKNNPQGYINT